MDVYSHNGLTFFVKKEEIIVKDNINVIAFLAYAYRNREGFNALKRQLVLKKKQFKNMPELAVYAQKHNLISVAGRTPKEYDEKYKTKT